MLYQMHTLFAPRIQSTGLSGEDVQTLSLAAGTNLPHPFGLAIWDSKYSTLKPCSFWPNSVEVKVEGNTFDLGTVHPVKWRDIFVRHPSWAKSQFDTM